jgi:hypothetical protein
MHVVVDTTTLFQDKLLVGTLLRTIATSLPRLGGALWVPEVVRSELRGQVRADIVAAIKMFGEARDTLERFAPGLDLVPPPELDDLHGIFEREFAAQFGRLGLRSLPYPAVGLEELIEGYYRGLRPYKPNGTGWKDYLVWRSVLEIAQSEAPHEIVFVTANTKDFCGDAGLHPDLLEEARRLGIDPTRLHHVRHLRDVHYEKIVPLTEKLNQFLDELRAGKGPDLDVIGLDAAIRGIRSGTVDIGLAPGLSNFGLDDLVILRPAEARDASKLPNGEFLIEAALPVRCDYHAIAHTSDWNWVSEELLVKSTDFDTEGQFVAFSASQEVDLIVRFTWDGTKATSLEAETAEVD